MAKATPPPRRFATLALLAAVAVPTTACRSTAGGSGGSAGEEPAAAGTTPQAGAPAAVAVATPAEAPQGATGSAQESSTASPAADEETGAATPASAEAGPDAAEPDCLFGARLAELERTTEFKASNASVEQRRAPGAATGGREESWDVTTYRHLPSGRLFHVYVTIDARRRGQERGWVERADDGAVVAELGDGEFTRCSATRHAGAAPVTPLYTCLFGTDVDELDDARGFAVTELPNAKRASRGASAGAGEMTFRVRELRHGATGRVYRVFRTFKDADDAGQAMGWIEAVDTGDVVAEIGAGEVYACGVTARGVQVRKGGTHGGEAGMAECRFGGDLHDLDASDDFVATRRGEVSRRSRITGDDERPKTFIERELKHVGTGKTFVVFNTVRQEDDGGRPMGWIEAMPEGEVVAEIGSAEIYNCKF